VKTIEPVLRQHHVAGEKLFVDYAGPMVPVVDRLTGQVREAQVFVAVLGASNYTFVEAMWTQGLADWIGSHRRCLEFLSGVPTLIVIDHVPAATIDDQLCGDTPDALEGPPLAADPGLHALVEDELYVLVPGVGERYHEAPGLPQL
jgi:transposase